MIHNNHKNQHFLLLWLLVKIFPLWANVTTLTKIPFTEIAEVDELDELKRCCMMAKSCGRGLGFTENIIFLLHHLLISSLVFS